VASEASAYRGRIAAVILTIRQDETDAVWSRLGSMEEVRGRVTYHVARVKGHKGELTVAVHRIREPGNGPAQSAANSAIEDLEPRLIVLVGIAGAVPSDDFSLGDVIVATRVADLRVQALMPDHSNELSVRSDRVHPGLVDRLTNLSELSGWSSPGSINVPEPDAPLSDDRFTADPMWNQKVRKSLEARFVARPRLPRHVTGELGSQDALVKDAAVLQTWLVAVRKVEGVEMEAAGVMEAAARTDALYPVLVVRGLSDVVGYKREAAWTVYACHTAAAFLLALLSSGRLDGVGPLRMSDDGEADPPQQTNSTLRETVIPDSLDVGHIGFLAMLYRAWEKDPAISTVIGEEPDNLRAIEELEDRGFARVDRRRIGAWITPRGRRFLLETLDRQKVIVRVQWAGSIGEADVRDAIWQISEQLGWIWNDEGTVAIRSAAFPGEAETLIATIRKHASSLVEVEQVRPPSACEDWTWVSSVEEARPFAGRRTEVVVPGRPDLTDEHGQKGSWSSEDLLVSGGFWIRLLG
jgi:nucleoside phosphorylase